MAPEQPFWVDLKTGRSEYEPLMPVPTFLFMENDCNKNGLDGKKAQVMPSNSVESVKVLTIKLGQSLVNLIWSSRDRGIGGWS